MAKTAAVLLNYNSRSSSDASGQAAAGSCSDQAGTPVPQAVPADVPEISLTEQQQAEFGDTGKETAEKMASLNDIKTAVKIGNKLRKDPLLFGAVLGAGVFAVDQLFKVCVEKQPDGVLPHPVAEKGAGAEIELSRLHNSGIAMGSFAEKPELAESLSAVGAAAAAASLASRDPKDRAGIVGDLLVLGGAASNIYDRVTRGYVVDYIHMKKGPLSKIVFNLGDAAIAAGALLGAAGRLFSPENAKTEN